MLRRPASLIGLSLIAVATAGGVLAAPVVRPTDSSASALGAASVITSPATLLDAGSTIAYSLAAPTSVAPSNIVARAIVAPSRPCPALVVTVGGMRRAVAMSWRRPGDSTGAYFTEVKVCSAVMPRGASAATVQGVRIPASMPRNADSIAYLADTGCRVKGQVQDCSSPTAWPLATNAQQVAARAPDLIIHGGDYVYREMRCPPPATPKCGGSPVPATGPFVDTAAIWFADAITPMQPMLSTAPIVAVRGNHEVCSTAGNGFFLFFDPRPTSAAACAPVAKGGTLRAPTYQSPSWSVDVDLTGSRSLRLVIVDSSYGWDDVPSSWVTRQRSSYARAKDLAKGARDSWLLVHRPVYGVTTTKYALKDDPQWVNWVSADQTAASYGLLAPYSLIMSGHEHLSQMSSIPGLPPQFIAGAGGTQLNPPTGYKLPAYGPLATRSGSRMAADLAPYPLPSAFWNKVGFGIVFATPGTTTGSWTMRYATPSGGTLGSCTAAARSATCS